APVRELIAAVRRRHGRCRTTAMLRGSRVVVAALALSACGRRAPAPEATVAVPAPRPDGRLPRQVHPARYALDFVIDPAQPRFTGRAQGDGIVDEPTRPDVEH